MIPVFVITAYLVAVTAMGSLLAKRTRSSAVPAGVTSLVGSRELPSAGVAIWKE